MNPCGETGLLTERALAWRHRAYGIQFAALRHFNAAGATPEAGEDHRPETRLLPRLLAAARGSNGAFQIYGDDDPAPDGTCVRDYVHVLDIAQAHILALRSLSKLGSRIYNMGNGKGYSIRAVLEAVEKITGRKFDVQVSGRRPGGPGCDRTKTAPRVEMATAALRPHGDQSVRLGLDAEVSQRVP